MNRAKNAGFVDRAVRISEKIEDLFVVKVIRDGLVTMIPILMIGAFALVLHSFPLAVWQDLITGAAGGFFYSLFHIIYEATFGVMSVYMVLSFSVNFFTRKEPDRPVNLWGIGSALASFMIMIGVWSDSFSLSDLGAVSVFLAIATALVSSEIFYALSGRYIRSGSMAWFGADSRLGSAMEAMLPSAVTIAIAALVAYLVTLTGCSTMHELVTNFFLAVFELIDSLFLKGLFFILISGVLWLFGIHGSDCLEGVTNNVFLPLVDANIQAVSSGGTPTEILCKPFFDCFILMGGCGSCLCLFLAVILFSRDRGMRTIAKTAGFPLLFNISELMVFGLPIVFNPILVIPFLLVPVLQYLIAYGAIAAGLVPHITAAVEWTTPVLISGYAATGSVAGSVLQLVNLAVGTAVYAPFVKMMGRIRLDHGKANRDAFVKWYMADESRLEQTRLLGLHGICGDMARRIALELHDAVKESSFRLYYQPQYNYDGQCIGAEALLRWPAAEWLSIYPPLLIQLAREEGILLDLEKRILHRALSEREQVFRQFGRGIKISVNVTGSSAAQQEFWDYLNAQWQADPFTEGSLCIEVTEQDAIVFSDEITARFRSCREMGIRFAIDDFSAGQTSIKYLKNGIFDMLKLDGALVKVVNENSRCRDIIASLVVLSDSLHIDCLAEYVENEAIRQTLHAIGCDLYQGYLYSPAVPLKAENEK